jgi:hypothetical protein
MLGSDILSRYKNQMPSFDMSDEGQLADIDNQNALRTYDAGIQKRKAAAEFQNQRRLTAENESAFIGGGNRDDTNWVAEMAGLRKPPEAKWWGANDQQMMNAPTDQATPGGAGLMGRGDTMRSPLDSLAALGSNMTPRGGGGGMPAGGSGAAGGGEVTMSPGGNYSRGPALDDMGIERLKQAKLQTTSMEQNLPQSVTDRARNNALFNIGQQLPQIEAINKADVKDIGERTDARRYFDPDIYREMESKLATQTEAQAPARDLRALEAQYKFTAQMDKNQTDIERETIRARANQMLAGIREMRQAVTAMALDDPQRKMIENFVTMLQSMGADDRSFPPGLALAPSPIK